MEIKDLSWNENIYKRYLNPTHYFHYFHGVLGG